LPANREPIGFDEKTVRDAKSWHQAQNKKELLDNEWQSSLAPMTGGVEKGLVILDKQ